MRDTFTSTVEGAEAFERAHAEPDLDDVPSARELAEDEWDEEEEPGPCCRDFHCPCGG